MISVETSLDTFLHNCNCCKYVSSFSHGRVSSSAWNCCQNACLIMFHFGMFCKQNILNLPASLVVKSV